MKVPKLASGEGIVDDRVLLKNRLVQARFKIDLLRACAATVLVLCAMIKSIRHKGLRALFETGDASGVLASHRSRLRLQLAALDTAVVIQDLDLPGFALHPLKGALKGRWSVRVSGNWRLTFEFVDGNVYILDYEDYH